MSRRRSWRLQTTYLGVRYFHRVRMGAAIGRPFCGGADRNVPRAFLGKFPRECSRVREDFLLEIWKSRRRAGLC
jgi:hypothetical protein